MAASRLPPKWQRQQPRARAGRRLGLSSALMGWGTLFQGASRRILLSLAAAAAPLARDTWRLPEPALWQLVAMP